MSAPMTLLVGCTRCGVRQEVPRWPLPGKVCGCGGELSLTAGSTQVLEKSLLRAKQAAVDALEGTIDDAGVLPLPFQARLAPARAEDPLERTVDDAGVLPLPIAARLGARAPAGPAPVARTQEDARVLAIPTPALPERPAPGGEPPPRALGSTREDARVLPVPDASAGLEASSRPVAEEGGEPVSAPAPWIAGYELREEIGRGAYGTVYRAHDPRHEREVALKVLDRLEPRAKARFQRELLATARLRHPNVVCLLDSGKDEAGRPYLVLELVRGPSLAQAWSGPCFNAADVAERVRLCRDVARALEHGHSQGVLHRDVKPENVLLDAEGRARLIDLGLARLGDDRAGLTVDGEAYGTPAYMSPEQAGSGHPVDARSDVYSLGATLYRGLAGHPPFEAGGVELFLSIFRTEPERPSASAPAVPPQLDAIVLRCLEKEPALRYPTAGELADDLDRWLAGTAVAARAHRRHMRRVQRHLPALAAGAVGLLVGVVASQVLLTARAPELSAAPAPPRPTPMRMEGPPPSPPTLESARSRRETQPESLAQRPLVRPPDPLPQDEPALASPMGEPGRESPGRGPSSRHDVALSDAPPPAGGDPSSDPPSDPVGEEPPALPLPPVAPAAPAVAPPSGGPDLVGPGLTLLLGLACGAAALLVVRAGARKQAQQVAVQALARWQAARAQAEPEIGEPVEPLPEA